MPSPADLQDVLSKLRERFVASSANTVTAFSQLADQLQVTPTAHELVESLRRELHRVHGTAGSYGFHEASRLAGALELVAMQWAADPRLDVPRRGAIVRQFVRSLQAALTSGGAPADRGLANRLLLVDLPDALAAALVPEAMHRGYFVERVSAAQLDAVLDGVPPQALIAAAGAEFVVPESVPVVLLVEPGARVPSRGGTTRVVDASTDPREILMVAESLSSHTRMAGATVLVIDDDAQMLELLRTLGEREGMFVRTQTATTDLEATIEKTRPALLLLDIALDGVDGIALTRQLRADPRHADLPIVLVSASSDAATREAAFAAGADDFQAKPIVASELLRRIERLLELRRQRQVARGIHPATGLWMRERALRLFGEALRDARAAGRPLAFALVRPVDPPDGVRRSALWHRECAILASALGHEGGLAGFLDETSLAILAPMAGDGLASRLEPFAEAAQGEVIAWCAGVAEPRAGIDTTPASLARDAEDGWLAARDRRQWVHRWDAADAGLAPDVVVVEDDVALADLLTFALASRGLTYRAFTTGPAALDALRAMRVHGRSPIVLLDVDLPGLDGFSLFERLRVERPGVFRVVFVSIRASEVDQLRALRAGALDYIAKPVSLRVLLAKIAMWRQGAAAS